MRVLLTSLPIRSHLTPVLVPLAAAFRARGHEVAIATGPRMGHLEHAVVMPDIPAPEDFGPPPPWIPERDGTLRVPLFHPALTTKAAANILDFARSWQPDVIVRETNEYGGRIAAEVLGIPHAVIDIAPFAPAEIPDLDELMAGVRAAFGVEAREPAFTASLLPAFWQPGEHHFRVPCDGTKIDGPPVVAAFGTNAGLLMGGSVLPRIVAEALGMLQVESVFAVGSGEWTGPRPANVRIVEKVPQQQLLNTAKVFVTHAGFSSVRESLTAGTPMVAVPLFADQPRNAARLEELNASVSLNVKDITAVDLAGAIRRVLDAPWYQGVAEAYADQVAELPVVEEIPDHLVSAL